MWNGESAMKNVYVASFIITLIASGCSSRCMKDAYITESFNRSNFRTVPYDRYKYENINFVDNETGCPTPKNIRVPKSIITIDEILSNGQKVSLYIKFTGSEGGGIYESKWENMYLDLFGSRTNFSIMDSAFFSKIDRIKTEADAKNTSPDELSFTSQTDRTKIMELTGVTHIYVMNRERARNGAFKTTYFSGRLLDMATGKVIAIDEADD